MYYVVRTARGSLVCTNSNELGETLFKDPDRQECLEWIYQAEKAKARVMRRADMLIYFGGLAGIIFIAIALLGGCAHHVTPGLIPEPEYGAVTLSWESDFSPYWNTKPDFETAEAEALALCQSWGYSSVRGSEPKVGEITSHWRAKVGMSKRMTCTD